MYDFTTLRNRRGIGAFKWSEIEHAGVTDEDVIPFSVADMDLLCAPEITAAIHEAADLGIYGYTGADDRFRQALAGWMLRRHNWQIQPEWIVNTFGVVHAIIQAVHAFTQPGEAVIYQSPAYPPFRRIPDAAGRTLLANPLVLKNGRYEMNFDQLEELCARPDSRLLLLCSPHNPTGRVWTPEELVQVAEICRKHNVLVFADEIHADFVFGSAKHTPFAKLEDHCVVATSASKTFNLAGLSTASILISDPELRRQFITAGQAHTGMFNNYFGLAASRAAYEKGEAWLEELLIHIQNNWTFAHDFLARTFPSVKVYPHEGTYLLWADFSSLGLNQQELQTFLREDARFFTDEGYIFGSEGSCFERIALPCPLKHLEKALERLDAAAARRQLPR